MRKKYFYKMKIGQGSGAKHRVFRRKQHRPGNARAVDRDLLFFRRQSDYWFLLWM